MALDWLNNGIGGHQTGQLANPYTQGGMLDLSQWQQMPAFAQNNPNGYTLYRNLQSGQMRGSKGTAGSPDFSIAEFAGLGQGQPNQGLAYPPIQTPDFSGLLDAFNKPAPAAPSYTSGINAGPVYSPEQTAGAVGAVRGMSAKVPNVYGVNASPAQGAEMQRNLDLKMGQQGNRLGTQLERGIAEANAKQLLSSQQARAQSGVTGGNLLATLYGQNLQNQLTYQNALAGLLSGMLV